MLDEDKELEHTEEETTSEELEEQETVETDEKDEGAEEPQTPKTPPSDEPSIPMSVFKKLATEYELGEQDFAKLDNPEAFAKRIMQQYKGFLGLSQRLEQASQGVMPPPLAPQDVPATEVPTAEDGAVDELLADPQGYLGKFMSKRDAKQYEQGRKIEMFRQDQAINQWASTLPAEEKTRLAPHYNNDPVIRLKRTTGQIITLQDAQAAYATARLNSANIQQVRQDGYDAGAASTDAKHRAAVESGKKRSGHTPVATLDELQKRLDAGEELTDVEINAAIAAEEAAQ